MTEETTGTGTVTGLLRNLDGGDRGALSALFPIVYEELRSIAHRQRLKWTGDETLGTTALVHEAYLKLVEVDHLGAKSRGHFLRVAAMAMRQILCNYARDHRAAKRGGGAPTASLAQVGEVPASGAFGEESTTLLDLDEALRSLEEVDERLAAVVECRFFGGLTIEDTAEALGTSPATVKRDWALARAWLFRQLKSA